MRRAEGNDMNKFTAFFKNHRRGIISTAAVLALDAVMLLVVHPLMPNIEDFETRFFYRSSACSCDLSCNISRCRDLYRTRPKKEMAYRRFAGTVLYNRRNQVSVRLAYVHRDRAFILDHHADNNETLQKQSRQAGEPQCLKYYRSSKPTGAI